MFNLKLFIISRLLAAELSSLLIHLRASLFVFRVIAVDIFVLLLFLRRWLPLADELIDMLFLGLDAKMMN